MSSLEEERDFLRKELRGTQEMLALVLYAVGEEVVIPKTHLSNGVLGGKAISIDDDQANNAFRFRLVDNDN